MSEILAYDKYATNADLIVACRDLGYLRDDWTTLDAAYGLGTFWKKWQPDRLVANDLDHDSPALLHLDFRNLLPVSDRAFDCVVFDPPYKLNGTPTKAVDKRYGVHEPSRWQDRMALCADGLIECARVLGDGYLLMKCQDQVCSGKVRWQTSYFTLIAQNHGLELVDRLDKLGGRKQPSGRRQVHARRNSSTMLVFKRAS